MRKLTLLGLLLALPILLMAQDRVVAIEKGDTSYLFSYDESGRVASVKQNSAKFIDIEYKRGSMQINYIVEDKATEISFDVQAQVKQMTFDAEGVPIDMDFNLEYSTKGELLSTKCDITLMWKKVAGIYRYKSWSGGNITQTRGEIANHLKKSQDTVVIKSVEYSNLLNDSSFDVSALVIGDILATITAPYTGARARNLPSKIVSTTYMDDESFGFGDQMSESSSEPNLGSTPKKIAPKVVRHNFSYTYDDKGRLSQINQDGELAYTLIYD